MPIVDLRTGATDCWYIHVYIGQQMDVILVFQCAVIHLCCAHDMCESQKNREKNPPA